MKCPSCESHVRESAKFCAECGQRVGSSCGQHVSTSGGDISGTVVQAGRDVVLNQDSSNLPSVKYEYEAVPKWRSPLTQALLSWVGLVIGVAGVLPVWQIFKPFVDLVRGRGVPVVESDRTFLWELLSLVVLGLLCAVLFLRRLTSTETRRPLVLGWAVSGYGRRITVERVLASRCPICGGKMKYYLKPTEWGYRVDSSGVRRREVVRKAPALECYRNPDHWCEVDPAEDGVA